MSLSDDVETYRGMDLAHCTPDERLLVRFADRIAELESAVQHDR